MSEQKIRDALASLLEIESEECRFDHKGYCQAHNLDHIKDGCRVALAREALAKQAVDVQAARQGQQPVAWQVTFRRSDGVIDSLIVSRREDAEKQVRREIILSVESLYTAREAKRGEK